MTTHTDPITTAVRLLKAAASSEHLAAAQALQDFAESLGAGGVQPLRPEGGPPGSGGWQFHAEEMERQRDHWRQRAQTMHEHQAGQVWYWQGDGGDHLESLVNSLPVVIRADQLRALLAEAQAHRQAVPEQEAIAWLVTWKGEQHTYAQAHASEMPAVDQARRMGGTVTPCAAIEQGQSQPTPGLVPLADVLRRVDDCMGPNSAVRLALEREFGKPAA